MVAGWKGLCVGFNDTRRDYPRDALVHHAFEAHALRSPDRTAVRFELKNLR